jgi:hypothetical protein
LTRAARALYEKEPTAAEMEAAGFAPEDYEGEVVEVWPENYRAFNLFCDLQTQWRIGVGGATGLDYGVLFHKMDRMRLGEEEYDQIERDIRVMEFEALSVMNKKT